MSAAAELSPTPGIRAAAPRILPLAAIACGAALIAAVALPLATYTLSIAAFGLAHVLSEMNYVRRRFAGRLGENLMPRFGLPIAVALLARIAGAWGVLPPPVTVPVELLAAAALALGAGIVMGRRRAAGTALGVLLAVGALVAPAHLLLLLALLHNLTPLGFVAEALEGPARRWMLTLLAIPFIALPLLIATGLPYAVLDGVGWASPEWRVLASGPLTLNLGVYVPHEFIDSDWALHAFSAAVFAQLAHYAAVILLLPRLAAGSASRPFRLSVPAAIAAAGAVLALVFVLDYDLARRLYPLAALVHAWIEIPVLLLALGGLAAIAQPVKA
jgi:hypothetical protein